jgi:predicted metal-dependent hydrolase
VRHRGSHQSLQRTFVGSTRRRSFGIPYVGFGCCPGRDMKKFTNKELQKTFRRFNKDFFQKRIRIRSRHVRFGNKKQCCNAEGICSKKNFIYINEELKKHPDLSFIILLHEMAHAVLFEDGYVGYGFDGGHGQRFYAELHRLYLAGAYENLL